MKAITISGSPRVNVGKKFAKSERMKDLVPCVIYGDGFQEKFTVEYKDLLPLVYTPNVHKVILELGGTSHEAILQDIQFHVLSDKILHVDFMKLNPSKPVTMEIPVKVTGSSTGVKQGGKLTIGVRKLKVRALPKDLPDNVEVNVDTLEIGQAIKIGTLKHDGITFLDAPNVVVVSVRMTRAAAAAAAEAAAPAKKK
jgi:large subunit ribosomal protein L25